MPSFVVAVRHGAETGARSLRELVEEAGGLAVTGGSNPLRLVVEGDDEAASRLRERHPDEIVVERIIVHDKL